jgi:hypothetical protein
VLLTDQRLKQIPKGHSVSLNLKAVIDLDGIRFV